jgi:hypothetical protein
MNPNPNPSPAPDAAEILALSDRHLRSPDDEAVAASLTERSANRPWFGGVPTADAGTVAVMAEFLRDYPAGSDTPLQVTSSSIELPSAVLAFHIVFPKAQFHPSSIGEPDPRAPLYPGEPTVWRYEGTTPFPAVVPPSPDAAERVRVLATRHWPHIAAAYRRAAPLADLALSDLCGTLVHPPAPPDAHWRADHWIRAVQVMACLGIAHHRGDQPWRESAAAGALVGLSLGPEDWVTEAACFALVASAWVDPHVRPDAGSAVAVRWLKAEKAAATRGVSILESLTRLVLACPWLDERVTERAHDLLTRIDESTSSARPKIH